jgi:hypothetical protein
MLGACGSRGAQLTGRAPSSDTSQTRNLQFCRLAALRVARALLQMGDISYVAGRDHRPATWDAGLAPSVTTAAAAAAVFARTGFVDSQRALAVHLSIQCGDCVAGLFV